MDPKTHELHTEDILFSIHPQKIPARGNFDAAIIGQSRALQALHLGLGINAKGYNIFIQGAPGTGRRTALLKALSDYTLSIPALQDKVYVSNFINPAEPKALSFPAGKAVIFKQEIHDLVEDIKKMLALQDSSDTYKQQQGSLLSSIEQEENRALVSLESEAAAAGFQIVQVSDGETQSTDLVPLQNGQAVSFDELQAQVSAGTLSNESWNALREHYYSLMDKMKDTFDTLKKSRLGLDKRVHDLQRDMIKPLLESQIQKLMTDYPDPKIHSWLQELQDDILLHLGFFNKDRIAKEQNSRRRNRPSLARYGVNILVDCSRTNETPIIFENRPSIHNLIGTIEAGNNPVEDNKYAYLRIRGGSILKASGGVLVLRAEDILEDEEAWQYLKRVLQTGIVEIQNQNSPFSLPLSIKPEPIEVQFKVILIGGELSYDLLFQMDQDFQKLFKVCAEFDSSMERTSEAEKRYASFISKIIHEEHLSPIEPDGIAAVLAQSARDAEHRNKLSTRFSKIADLLREADWLAKQEKTSSITASIIKKTLEMREFLYRLPEEKLQSMIKSNEIILQLSGTAIGKINGLAVHDRGYYAYGIPVVVSARVAPGDGDVINIEGESGLSGEIFDKAVLILSGYLRSRYARNFPLSITASVCFEQMYTAIDGDSATAVQLCAILSAISLIPLRQDLAMTGSVNQMGDMQPVGGISEKIEGFHKVCSHIGLSGSQGVIIPRRNIANLILNERLEKDIKAGLFHIYAVDNIDQALEVLSGKQAGSENDKGIFPANSLNGVVSSELKRMADVIRSYES